MTTQEAKEYIEFYFSENGFGFSEARSIWHEVTENGVFNKSHIELFDDQTMIDVAVDLQYQVRQEIGYLL